MLNADQYELLDFGRGRKLERFGERIVDRPSPAAERMLEATPDLWRQATARYERTSGDQGAWRSAATAAGKNLPPPRDWIIRHGPLTLDLRLTEFGHVGLFPEQADNWTWIAQQVGGSPAPLRVLNLFAYTGAATLAAAAAGAEVTHVDASRATVAWARRNAELSGMTDRPIRWIVEDAPTFVRRELKRGRSYHAVILDPPSYGHGPKGEAWKLAEQLPGLLADCANLTADDRRFLLLTCHTPGFAPPALGRLLNQALGGGAIETADLYLSTSPGRQLPCGAMARGR
ncbi:MAG TPA: class I SAM-dependent methyltransferase [Pirellulales bacterium]